MGNNAWEEENKKERICASEKRKSVGASKSPLDEIKKPEQGNEVLKDPSKAEGTVDPENPDTPGTPDGSEENPENPDKDKPSETPENPDKDNEESKGSVRSSGMILKAHLKHQVIQIKIHSLQMRMEIQD